MLVSAERGKVRLISCEIIFQEFQPIGYMITIPQSQTDRRTDTGQTTCHGNTAQCIALRGIAMRRSRDGHGSGHNFTQIRQVGSKYLKCNM